MKKVLRKWMAVLIVCVSVLGTIPSGVLEAQAATPTISKNLNFYLYDMPAYEESTYYVWMKNPKANAKITNFKSSNPKVAKISVNNSTGGNAGLIFKLKKAGTTKISFRYAGRRYARKVTVKQWESPCKQFKVGKMNFTKYFKKSEWFNYENRKGDVTDTISIKPKKGWKLLKIEVLNMYDGRKAVKNNSKITLSINGTGTGVYVYLKNKATGERQTLQLGYSSIPIQSYNMYNAFINMD